MILGLVAAGLLALIAAFGAAMTIAMSYHRFRHGWGDAWLAPLAMVMFTVAAVAGAFHLFPKGL
jgi:hypothetical protein